MRVLKGIIVCIVLIVLGFVSLAFLLPREAVVERSIQIQRPAQEVFPHVSSMKATQAWSPWLALDPDVKLEYSGPDAGVGAKMRWHSENSNVGAGSQEIIEVRKNEYVATSLDFGEMGTAQAAFTLQENTGETTLTWRLVSNAGNNPIARWMGLMLDSLVGAEYERGLLNLKNLVEAE